MKNVYVCLSNVRSTTETQNTHRPGGGIVCRMQQKKKIIKKKRSIRTTINVNVSTVNIECFKPSGGKNNWSIGLLTIGSDIAEPFLR